jgi:hypothetical protein
MMLIMTLLSMTKTITSLRVFDKFSPLVTMVEQVVKDLSTFLVFFLFLTCFFTIMFAIIGVERPVNEYGHRILAKKSGAAGGRNRDQDSEYNFEDDDAKEKTNEYSKMTKILKFFLFTYRGA